IAISKLMGAEQASWTPWTVDDKKMQEALEGLTDPAQRRSVLEKYKKQTGVDLHEVIEHKMTGNDRKIAECLEVGDTIGADMHKIDEASNGGWLNAIQDAGEERFGIPKSVTKAVTTFDMNPSSLVLPPPPENATLDGYSFAGGNIHKVDSDTIMQVLGSVKDPAD